jgi:hypothetical protein
VLVEKNAGATTSFGYEVHLVARGKSPSARNAVAWFYRATRNKGAYGANLVWRNPTLLVVEFMKAEEAKLESPFVEIDGTKVWIALQDGLTDSSAPSGGMLYNLRGRRMPK